MAEAGTQGANQLSDLASAFVAPPPENTPISRSSLKAGTLLSFRRGCYMEEFSTWYWHIFTQFFFSWNTAIMIGNRLLKLTYFPIFIKQAHVCTKLAYLKGSNCVISLPGFHNAVIVLHKIWEWMESLCFPVMDEEQRKVGKMKRQIISDEDVTLRRTWLPERHLLLKYTLLKFFNEMLPCLSRGNKQHSPKSTQHGLKISYTGGKKWGGGDKTKFHFIACAINTRTI